MKNRSGFVSNSSSSSFIIAWKSEYDEDDLRLMFKEVCGIPKESPVHGLHEYVFNVFMDNVEYRFDTISDYEEWTKNNCYYVDEFKKYKELLENGFVVRRGEFSTENGSQNPIEYYFASHSFNYTSDDFIIEHDGSY